MNKARVATRIKEIWSDALGINADEATDFFMGGGHSFLAIDIVARLGDEFEVDIPLRALFDHPILGDFSAVVEQLVERGASA